MVLLISSLIKVNSKEIDGVPVTGTPVGSRTVMVAEYGADFMPSTADKGGCREKFCIV